MLVNRGAGKRIVELFFTQVGDSRILLCKYDLNENEVGLSIKIYGRTQITDNFTTTSYGYLFGWLDFHEQVTVIFISRKAHAEGPHLKTRDKSVTSRELRQLVCWGKCNALFPIPRYLPLFSVFSLPFTNTSFTFLDSIDFLHVLPGHCHDRNTNSEP